jgi:hypothetical protein
MITPPDDATPNVDPFDEELADALASNRTEENVRDNARLVAAYYTTLTENGVDAENATEITCLWLTHVMQDGEG